MFTCAWCGKEIPEDHEIFGLKAKARDRKLLKGHEGRMIEIALLLTDKVVPVGVAGKGSPARREGWDMVFPVCSEECARQLKAALLQEVSLFEEVMGQER